MGAGVSQADLRTLLLNGAGFAGAELHSRPLAEDTALSGHRLGCAGFVLCAPRGDAESQLAKFIKKRTGHLIND